MNETILIVDDEKMITSTLSNLLKISLKQDVITYNDPVQALNSEALASHRIDLIISDFMMPGMNGLEFLKNVRVKCPETITILLTGYADKENAIRGINEVGLYYYLEKPWDNNDMIKVIKNGLEKKELTDSLKVKYSELENSNREIARLYDLLKKDFEQEVDSTRNLVISLANVIEAKDSYTDGHTRRVGFISRKLGERLGLDAERLIHLETAGIIHDIGKVSVPDNILNKPGKLDEDEFGIMKRHTTVGETICKPLNSLRTCLDPIRHHHEKLNGSGYPDGLSGNEISLESRIIAVADIFDALYSKRPYRDKLPIEKTKEIMKNEVNNGCLDKQIVAELFDMIKNEDFGEITG